MWADKTHLEPRISPDLLALKDLLNSLHLEIHSLHASFSDVDIALLDEEARKSSLKLIKKSMESRSETEGEIVIVHLCSTETSGNNQSYLKAKNKTEDSLCTLATFAEKLGIKIAVENLPNIGGWGFGTDVSQLSELISELNNPRLGLCLDTGHVLLEEKMLIFQKLFLHVGRN
jgi:sugar phosphate isomerase/epimerase